MKHPAKFRRTAAAAGLAATAVLSVLSIALAPEFPSGFEDRLAAVEAGGTTATVSALAFVLAQLPFVAGVLGLGHLLRDRSPLLSNLGTSLAVVGAFGHSVFGGVLLVQLTMAADSANRSVHAPVLESLESGPAVAFMAMGLLGTVLGLVLLAVGLWRGRVGPQWAGPALIAFVMVEFAGSGISEWAAYVSGVLYLVTFVALATAVWRSPVATWQQTVLERSPELRH